jgi:hypothetical protein
MATVTAPRKAPQIVKAGGVVEPFNPEKLAWSLQRAGAGEHTARSIADRIQRTMVSGVSTEEIYRRAFMMLRKEARPLAARYSLRRAMLEIGPTGFPFEDFVSHLFKKEGWAVETRKVIMGKCVPHEVDVYATRGTETLAAELKYHNDSGYKTDVKIALYVKARFEDIWQCDPAVKTCPVDRGCLITNTKFTSQAVAYAACAGLELIGWTYPEGANLFDRMIAAKVYPVSALTTLKVSEKRLLLARGVIAVDMLRGRRDALTALGMSAERIGSVLAEADALLALDRPSEDGKPNERTKTTYERESIV